MPNADAHRHRDRARATARATAAAALCALVVLTGGSGAGSSAAAGAAEIALSVTPAQPAYGQTLQVAGRVSTGGDGLGGAPLALQMAPYPYRTFITVAHLVSEADGSFTFSAVRAQRNSRLRVVLAGAPAQSSRTLEVVVDPTAALAARSLGPGRVRLGVRLGHAPHLYSPPVRAWWFLAARGEHRFHLAAVTTTRELAGALTYASATVNPPARSFAFRVCLHPAWMRALGAAARACPSEEPPRVGSRPGAFEYGGSGRGFPAAAFPSARALAAAAAYLDARAGRTAFAVVDSAGRLRGLRVRDHFQTASVVKVMMLVAYLQMLDAHHLRVRARDDALLRPMIHVSDNSAASAVLGVVGEAALARVAREAGMQDYAPGVGWWAFTQTSAADQARFFFRLDRLIPPRFYAYALGLLSSIEASQSWGIPPVARPRFEVFFKTGQLPSEGLYNEAARLERPGETFAIAVLTTADPAMSYGQETVEGVARALLGG
jgi:Beta-lactamase enzyme family